VGWVQDLDVTFEPPTDLDPVALLESHLAVGWEHEVEVVFDAPVEDVTRWVPLALGRLEALGETATRLVGSTSNTWSYAAQLAGVPAAYRIIEGPELRASARTLGERALAATTTAN